MAKQTIDNLAVVVSASSEQLGRDLTRAAKMVENFAKSVGAIKGGDIQVAKNAAGDLSAARRLTDTFVAGARASIGTVGHAGRAAFGGVAHAARGAAGSVASFARDVASTATGMVAAQAGIAGIGSALDGVRESVRLASDAEQLGVAFTTMLGSAEKATSLINDIRTFSRETPFGSREIATAARQLMAYGVQAGQVIPVLRTLGDVTAGLGGSTSLQEMSYLYGTLMSQGRAYTVDLKQLAGRGVAILDPLAKQFGVTKDEVFKLAEEGRIMGSDVGRALDSLRQRGGPFFDMMKKQSETLRGVWEAASDTFELAKTSFGRVVIEEVGLKDAARDFENFAKRLDAAIAAPDSPVRKGVRFLGDLGKGIVQTTYEFGRAAVKIAEINLSGLSQMPGAFGDALRNVREMIADLQNFKIDPSRITRIGLDIFAAVGGGIARTVDWLDTVGRGWADAFKTNFVNPILDAVSALKDVLDVLRESRDSWLGLARELLEDKGAKRADALERLYREGGWRDRPWTEKLMKHEVPEWSFVLTGRPTQAEYPKHFGPRRQGETDKAFASRFRDVETMIGLELSLANDTEQSDRQRASAKANLDALHALRTKNFLEPFYAPGMDYAAIKKQFDAGQVPRANRPIELAPAPVIPKVEKPKSNAEQFAEFFNKFEAESLAGLERRRQQEMADEYMRWLLKATSEMRATADTLTAFRAGGGFGNVLRSFGPAAAATGAGIDFGPKVADLVGVLSQFAPHPAAGGLARQDVGLRFEATIPEDVRQLGNRIRDELDPMRELTRFRQDLDRAVRFGQLTRGEADMAYTKRAASLNPPVQHETYGTYKLPDAAMKDTTESVRILNQWAAANRGNAKQSVEGWLERLVRLAEQELAESREMNRKMPTFEVAPLPRG